MSSSSSGRAKSQKSEPKAVKRRLFLERLEDRSMLSAIAVTNLNDHGAGSLRQALLDANRLQGNDVINFAVAGTIQLTSALPTILSNVDIEGNTAPGYAGTPLVEVNFHGASGLQFAAGSAGSTLSSLSLVNATGSAVTLNRTSGVTIAGDYIGLALDGTTVGRNSGDGITVSYSTGDTIGGTSAAARNVISGNGNNGITLTGSSTNTIEGNDIGTNAAGTLARANTGNGIMLGGISKNNTIGGTSGNLVSGNNSNGILINGQSSGNTLAGNTIGLAAGGNAALGNKLDGVDLQNATSNVIGNTNPVSSITYNGITSVTTSTGTILPVSGLQGIRAGDNAGQYLITGTTDSSGLLYEGTMAGVGTGYTVNYPRAIETSVYGPNNLGSGVLQLVGTYKNSDYATAPVEVHSFIFQGTTAQLGNPANYTTIDYPGAKYTYVHSVADGLVVGNYDSPVDVGGTTATYGPGSAFIYNLSTHTYTTIAFPGAPSNSAYGIWSNGGSSYTIVGGYSMSLTNNVNNQDQPLGTAFMVDYDSSTGKFTNWTSFTYPYGTNYLTHFQGISSVANGVYTMSADSAQSGTGTVIQGSLVTVVRNADGSFGPATWVNLNYNNDSTITSNDSVIGNNVVGFASGGGVITSMTATVNTSFQLSNVISGNGANGIELNGASNNQIAMNNIGTNAAGTAALGNGANGILITNGSANNLIGGEATGGNDPTNDTYVRPPQGNLISGNSGDGVLINGAATANQLSGNFIGTTASGSSALGNLQNGVAIVNANGNSLIGCNFTQNPFVFYNVIDGNGQNGLLVDNSNNTTIQANFFGVGADNTTGVGNTLNGVIIEGSSTNTVMGGPIPLGNVDSDNGQNGIVVQDTASGFTSYNTFDGGAAFTNNSTLGNGHDGMLITTSGSNILIRTNIIVENANDGIEIGGNATGVRFAGNFVGEAVYNGTIISLGNKNNGVEVDGNANGDLIGGPQPVPNIIPQNTISANGGNGVAIDGNAHNITVSNSFIGVTPAGTGAAANGGAGVYIGGSASNNTIGSVDSTLPTLISGNHGDGIEMNGTSGNTVIGTDIGTDATGKLPVANGGAGIALINSSKNTIGSTSTTTPQNIIAFNTTQGVNVSSGTQDAILNNSIFGNISLGIQLGSGANLNQAAPVLTAAHAISGGTQISGTLTSTPNTKFTLEFFASTATGTSGRYPLGSVVVTTNALGVATFTFTGSALPSGATFVTATATDPNNNTSQFSNSVV